MGVYICNTEKDDVKKALTHLKESGALTLVQDEEPQIIMVGMRKYANLKKAAADIIKHEVEKKRVTHVINLNTMTIHKEKCQHSGKNILKAYLVNVGAAGLRLCKHCM